MTAQVVLHDAGRAVTQRQDVRVHASIRRPRLHKQRRNAFETARALVLSLCIRKLPTNTEQLDSLAVAQIPLQHRSSRSQPSECRVPPPFLSLSTIATFLYSQ